MAKISPKVIEEYRKILQKDVNSKAFAPLAEALRETGEFTQAEVIAANGVRRHPHYVGGYVALGRVLVDQGRFQEALPILRKAAELDPENLLALQLLGTLYLQTDQAKEALKTFKRILFLNPQSEKARNAVQKLETVSADEYEEDIFEYKSLRSPEDPAPRASGTRASSASATAEVAAAKQQRILPGQPVSPGELERKLSFVDALIVRNDLEKARTLLMELGQKLPGNEEIGKRFDLLNEAAPEEEAMPLHPLRSREQVVVDRKRHLLENLLRRIKQIQEDQIVETSNG